MEFIMKFLCSIFILSCSSLTLAETNFNLTEFNALTVFGNGASIKAGTSRSDQVVFSGLAARKILNFKPDDLNRGPNESSIYNKISGGTVLIVADDGIGSGALITNGGHILTNYHVVGQNKNVEIYFKPASQSINLKNLIKVVGVVEKVNQSKDLALVKVQSVPIGARPIPIKLDVFPSVGEDAHAVGHPRGEVWTYTKGYVSQVRESYEWKGDDKSPSHRADVIQTQTPINPGNSGGPLVNSIGELIGLNSFINANSPGINFAIATSSIRDFLKQKGNVVFSDNSKSKSCSNQSVGEKRVNMKAGPALFIYYDPECKGYPTVTKIVPDDSSRAIVFIFEDKNSNDKSIMALVDYNRDGVIDGTLIDNDGDGSWDLRGDNKNGENVASDLRPV